MKFECLGGTLWQNLKIQGDFGSIIDVESISDVFSLNGTKEIVE